MRNDNFLKIIQNKLKFHTKIKWRMVIVFFIFHISCLVWTYSYAISAKWQTLLFVFLNYHASVMGITCGVHRLWSHKAYKATVPLRIYLALCFASNGQMSVYDWVKTHRQHHKFSDTAADPHDSNQGLFYSHIGWLMLEKNDLAKEKKKQIDMSDIEADKVVMFEKKYSNIILFLCVFLPILVPIYVWGEHWKCAVTWVFLLKNLLSLHAGLTVNSFSHKYGYKPYNKHIPPADNLWVSIYTTGEGIHNYHHMFPYDYRCSETVYYFNISGYCIWLWAKMGLAYDLKEATPELVQATVTRLKAVEKDEKMSTKENLDM